MRFLALLVAGFLFVSSLEAWAGYWLAGRWFIGSRFATVSLGTVKNWLDRGIIRPTTQTAKIFVNRYGKIILLTLGLSQVIPEVEQRIQAMQYCYDPNPISEQNNQLYISVGSYSDRVSFSRPYHPYTLFYELTSSCERTAYQGSGPYYLTTYRVYRWEPGVGRWVGYALVAQPGTYTLVSRDGVRCTATLTWRIPLQPCSQAQDQAWQNERRQVPVRVFPNPADFVRPDVIEADPSLRWLRDEYNRIARDPAIPLIPSDALRGLDLPRVDWDIPPEEAIDSAAESSRDAPRPSTDAPPDAPPRDRPRDEDRPRDDSLSVPGFDTSLPGVERRSFPSELINTIVQSHPLLRVLQGVSLDVGGGGSCVVGSPPFQISFCDYAWVFNLMGGVIVFAAFLTGLFWAGRSE